MPKPGELDLLLMQVGHLHYKHAHCLFSQQGVTEGQPKFIAYLMNHEGSSQRELARRFDLEPATVTAALRRMEKAGIIERRADERDLRVSRIFLTDEGRRLFAVQESVRLTLEGIAFEGFSSAERAEIAGYLMRLRENLRRATQEE